MFIALQVIKKTHTQNIPNVLVSISISLPASGGNFSFFFHLITTSHRGYT